MASLKRGDKCGFATVIKIVHGAPSVCEKLNAKLTNLLSPRESEKTRFSKCDYAETIRATQLFLRHSYFLANVVLRL